MIGRLAEKKQHYTPPPEWRAGGETNSAPALNLSRRLVRHSPSRPDDGGTRRAVGLAKADVPQIGTKADYLIGGENRGLYLCGHRDHLHHRHGQLR